MIEEIIFWTVSYSSIVEIQKWIMSGEKMENVLKNFSVLLDEGTCYFLHYNIYHLLLN